MLITLQHKIYRANENVWLIFYIVSATNTTIFIKTIGSGELKIFKKP